MGEFAREGWVNIAGGCCGTTPDYIEAIAAAVRDAARPGSLLLLFADTYHLEADALLGGLARHLPGVRVVGGGASEDGTLGQVSVFAGDAATSAAVSGVLLAGETTHSVGVTQAVRRVGPVRRVTCARGNWVLTLDGRPAYEAFAAVVPEPLLAQPRRALAVVLACMVVGEDDFIARHLASLDPEHGAVALPAPVAPGMELFFCVRDPMGARDDLQRMLARAESAWGATRPVGGLYVSCVGRGRGFYGVPGLDTAYIRRQLGALPIAGFFSGAEFAPGGGVSLLHQYTGVLTMLGWGGARV